MTWKTLPSLPRSKICSPDVAVHGGERIGDAADELVVELGKGTFRSTSLVWLSFWMVCAARSLRKVTWSTLHRPAPPTAPVHVAARGALCCRTSSPKEFPGTTRPTSFPSATSATFPDCRM